MPRPPLPVGTFGKIDFFVLANKRIRARASFRDFDGRRRFVTRYGASKAQAERRLREALRDRAGPGDDGGGADSRMSAVVALWLADVDASDLAAGTKRVYHFAVRNYILPGLGELRLREITVPAVDRLAAAVRANHGAGAATTTRSVLSGILGEAVRRGALTTNPVRDASPQGSARRITKGPRTLTHDEARAGRPARRRCRLPAPRPGRPRRVHARHRRAHR